MKPYDKPDYWSLIRQIRAIDRAGGDSTLARLITADWLQDNGEDERAEFVRVQVRYAAIQADDTPERDELSELLLTRFAIFVATSTPFAPDCPNRMWPAEIYTGVPREWDWLGGWLSAVRFPIAAWLAHGPDICRRHPVRKVSITDREPASHRTRFAADPKFPLNTPFWYGAESARYSHWVPKTVFDLTDFDPGVHPLPARTTMLGMTRSDSVRYYLDHDAAMRAMNRAALLWAETEADR